jgi:S1-C subfamily serine protease
MLLYTFFLFFLYFSFAQSDLPTLIANAEKAVCFIETFDENNNPLMIGTGFFIDEDGTCVSNYHVFAGSYYAKLKRLIKTNMKLKKFLNHLQNMILLFLKYRHPVR